VKPALLNSDEGVGERQHTLSFLLIRCLPIRQVCHR
jgi:hypothetical protein